MEKLLTFQEALTIAEDCKKKHLLTGNGFSIACRPHLFKYDSLFEQADFEKLNPSIKRVFEVLDTKDFEVVMKSLRTSAEILRIYLPKQTDLIQQLNSDANELKNVLVNAIANSHPINPSEINEAEYQSCQKFLKNFSNYYTLNYDLLLYWTFMHFQDRELNSDDGFRTPDGGKADYVSWDIEKTDGQNLFYLHGALHVFDAKSELQKYTWINTGIKLIDQIRSALDGNLFPVFVAEGKSIEKVEKIMHSNYLSRGLRSFSHIGGCLFIYGHSLALNDSHILNLIPKSKITKLFVSLLGDIGSDTNKKIIQIADSLVQQRRGNKKIDLFFYSAESTHVWR
ncbi:MAG: hypothetical protein JWO58_603 [Chitinophagaceae bacterium]|nr:hypothetical protein [Chitinophagaceae bacterium]